MPFVLLFSEFGGFTRESLWMEVMEKAEERRRGGKMLGLPFTDSNLIRQFLSFFFPSFYQIIPCKKLYRTSLVAQCIGVCLPMQGTRVRSLVREDFACHGVTKSCVTTTEPTHLEPVLCHRRSHPSEKPAHYSEE